MTGVFTLWLPIVVSAVGVFVISSIIHMALPFWHKGDYSGFPEEDKVAAALRPFHLTPGDYMLPRPGSMSEMKSSGFAAKMKEGPVMMATVLPNGMTSMGRNLGLWFLYTLVISFLAGCVVYSARPAGPGVIARHTIVHFAAFSAFLAYAGALWPQSIWYRKSWVTTIKSTIDGLIYAAATGLIFALLWPK